MHLSFFTDVFKDAKDHRLQHKAEQESSIFDSFETASVPDAPHISDSDIQILLERIQECKMVEQMRSLLNTLPLESENLLSALSEA